MKDCVVKSEIPSKNSPKSFSLKSILNSDCSSSSESLVTLLNASIAQQARFSQSISDMSNSKHISSKKSNMDDDLEMLVLRTIQKKQKENVEESEPEESPRKRKHKDRDLNHELEISTSDEVLRKKHKKRKHKHLSISEIEEDTEKMKKKKRKELNYSEDNIKRLKSISPILNESEYQRKKSKKKHKHSSVSEPEDNNREMSISPVKIKLKKKHKHSNMSEDINGQDNISEPEEIILENDSVQKIKRKKKKHKHSDMSEDINGQEYISKPEEIISENDSVQKIKRKKKKHKHSSISEIEDISEPKHNHEETISEIDSPKKIKRKKKHKQYCSISEVEDSGPENKSDSICSKEEIKIENGSFTKADEEDKNIDADDKHKKLVPKKSLNTSILDNVKNKHKKYYLKSENNENGEVDDANTSKVMDSINEALDTALEKKLNDVDMSVLNDLYISVPWELPESHTIETRLSRPTYEQQKQFKQLDFAMKSGPYNKDEDQKIKNNWEAFCQDHNLKISPLIFFPVEGENRSLLPPEQRIKFVRYLGKGLKHRTLSSIYNRFQLLFRPFKKGKFSPEEDNIILTFVENSKVPNKYSALSTILNRGRELIKKRHQVLKSDDEKISWNMSLLQDLVNNLLEVTGKNNVDDLKDFSIEPAHWKALQKKMGIPALKIKRKWGIYLYPRLFIEEYNKLSEIREKLIQILYEDKVEDRRKINWSKLAENFVGMTNTRLYKIFLDMLAQYAPHADKINFRDTVIGLKGMLPHMLVRNKTLSKFMHRNGELFDFKILEPVVTF